MPKQPNARISQDVIEALLPLPAATNTISGAGVTQDVVEALITDSGSVRVSQDVVEALITDTGNVRVSQDVVEALIPIPGTTNTAVGAAVTQDVVEALITDTGTVRVSQDIIEALFSYDEGEPAFTTVHGQAQGYILAAATYVHGQAQAQIKQTYFAHGQAQSQIKQTYQAYGQSQALIGQIGRGFGQAQGTILQVYYAHANAQGQIKQTYFVHAQAQAYILILANAFGQAQASILATYYQHAQANAYILGAIQVHGQAQAKILQTYFAHGQTQASVKTTYQAYGQTQAHISVRTFAHAQSQAYIVLVSYQSAQAQAKITAPSFSFGQAQATIINLSAWKHGQAAAMIYTIYLLDTFTRTTSSGTLGSPNIGPDYTSVDPDISADGSTIVFTATGTSTASFNIPTGLFPDDYIIQFEFTTSETSHFYLEVYDGQYAYLYGNNDNPLINIDDDVSTNISLVDNQTYVFKLIHIGTTVRLKVWNSTDPEPAGWMLTATPGIVNDSIIQIYLDPNNASINKIDNLIILTSRLNYNKKAAYGLARARIKRNPPQFAQAMAFIDKFEGFGQAQARINSFMTLRYGQARTSINQGQGAGQAQALISGARRFAQARARIKRLADQSYGQAQAFVVYRILNTGQAQARLLAFDFNQYGQATALISSNIKIQFGNAQAIIGRYIFFDTFTRTTANGVFGTPDIGNYTSGSFIDSSISSANANGSQFVVVFPSTSSYSYIYAETNVSAKDVETQIEFSRTVVDPDMYNGLGVRRSFSQVSTLVFNNKLTIYAQSSGGSSAQSEQFTTPFTVLANTTYVLKLQVYGNTAKVKMWDKSGVEPDWMGSITLAFNDRSGYTWWDFDGYDGTNTLAHTLTIDNYNVFGSEGFVIRHGLARARIKLNNQQKHAQAQADIFALRQGYGNAQAVISKLQGVGQAQAMITAVPRRFGQAAALIKEFNLRFGQAQGIIRQFNYNGFGQVLAFIKPPIGLGQSQAYIKKVQPGIGQAQALIARGQKFGQAKAYIIGGVVPPGEPPITGGPGTVGRTYIVDYNGYPLPGFATRESIESESLIVHHVSLFKDVTLSEHIGLPNKLVSLQMTVWEPTYYIAKNKIQEAATILRSRRSGFAPLYIQRIDRHYEALAKKITMESSADQDQQLVNYQIEFECKPWLVSNEITTITGTTLLDTNDVLRDIYSGGWTPVSVLVTGTDVTISGYTDTEFTGFISVSGAVNQLTIDSENYIVSMNGVNRNDLMKTVDYTLYVGPGRTRFAVTGASSCVITYRDRWYL